MTFWPTRSPVVLNEPPVLTPLPLTQEVRRARHQGIHMVPIGVTAHGMDELLQTASDQVHGAFFAPSFNELSSLHENVTRYLLEGQSYMHTCTHGYNPPSQHWSLGHIIMCFTWASFACLYLGYGPFCPGGSFRTTAVSVGASNILPIMKNRVGERYRQRQKNAY